MASAQRKPVLFFLSHSRPELQSLEAVRLLFMLLDVFLENMSDQEVIVKLDFSNAFNTVRRDAILNAVATELPELYRLCYSAHAEASLLQLGDHTVVSAEGVQQGDPLG